MGTGTIAFRIARDLLGRCQQEVEELTMHRLPAMQSRDQEDFLQLAILAHEWIQKVTLQSRSIGDHQAFVQLAAELRDLRDSWIGIAKTVLSSSKNQAESGLLVSELARLEEHLTAMQYSAAEEARLAEISRKVPNADELSLIAIDPPAEWLDEASWASD
jgi:hypothetical protein